MKILVIGDFHGEFPKKLLRKVKNLDYDIILSPGDYCGYDKFGPFFFKHMYGKNEKDIPKSVMKKYDEMKKISFNNGFKLIKKLKMNFSKPFFGIGGNWDPVKHIDLGRAELDRSYSKRFRNLFNKNFNLLELDLIEYKDYILIFGISSSHPGKIDKMTLKKVEGRSGKNEVKNRVKEYKRREKRYNELFGKARNMGKPVIFLTHNIPYNTKLDILKRGPSKGMHYGSYLERKIIDKYKPFLVVAGHIHENAGKDFVNNKKTTIINAGATYENKAGLIEVVKDRYGRGKVVSVNLIR